MSVFDMAKKYYPKFWDKKRINDLVKAGRLTKDEENDIIGNEEDVHNVEHPE